MPDRRAFTAWPFLGSRRVARVLSEDGFTVNRKCGQRLVRRMGVTENRLRGYEPTFHLAGNRVAQFKQSVDIASGWP
jgi:hypothetical protein